MDASNTIPTAMSDASNLADWKNKVLSRDGGTCINCGSSRKVVVCFVVPPEVGGKLAVSNGVTICRECRIAAEGARVLPARIDNKTPINFFIGADLHKELEAFVTTRSTYSTISALVRWVITSFIVNPEMYEEDLPMWQSPGSDVKVNGWVDGTQYETFKHMCQDRNLSYTDALKALLCIVSQNGTEKSE